MRNYENIKAWQFADDLVVQVYAATRAFPPDERFGLTSQWRRAVISVPANIAEGSARESLKDYLHFLHIARGSLSEAKYYLHLARRLGYLNEKRRDQVDEQIRLTFVRLHGLIRAVKSEVSQSQSPKVP